jgi:hypothetical protein
VTGLRRHLHPSDRGVLAKDLDLGPRHLHLRAMERAAPAHQRPVEQRLQRRGAGPVFRAGDPLQGGGEKAKLRVAFDFGKAVAVDAQDVPKSSVRTSLSATSTARAASASRARARRWAVRR